MEYTDTLISNFPGLVVSKMETGGMILDENGEVVDFADLPPTTDHPFFDANNPDFGCKGFGQSIRGEMLNDENDEDEELGEDDICPDALDTTPRNFTEEENRRLILHFGDREEEITSKPNKKDDVKCPHGGACSGLTNNKGALTRVEGRHKESHCTKCACL